MNQNWLEGWVEESLARKRLEQNNNFEQLSKLTIVIPSCGRQDFLLRQAVYWGYSRANVIIVDGSPDPLTDRMSNIFTGLPNFRYLHAKDNYVNRLKLASGYIQTPYVVTLSDDEFLLKGALCRAITLLDNDSELVACNGQVVGFGHAESGDGVSYYDAAYTFWKYAISEDQVQGRLAHAMATYNAATCYAVLRRDVWVRGWGNMQAWSSPYAGEIYQAITTYLYGKLDTVDEVYMMRSNENKPVNIKRSFDRKLSFEEWWFSPRFATERVDFISQLAATAMGCSGLNVDEVRKIVEDAVVVYLACSKERKKGALLRSIRNTTRATISEMLCRIMSPRAFRKLKLRIKRLVGENPQGGAGENMYGWQMFSRSSNVVNNQVEIQGVESLVVEFYEVLAKSKVMQ